MDHTSLSPGRFRLRAGIYLVPTASDPVTPESMRNAVMICSLFAGENFPAGDVTDADVAGTTWCKPPRDGGYAPGPYGQREGWTMMQTACIAASAGPAPTSGSRGGRH